MTGVTPSHLHRWVKVSVNEKMATDPREKMATDPREPVVPGTGEMCVHTACVWV